MKLFEICSAQADYKIPQASQKGVDVPKTANGEDLGVGKGWWYEGSCRGAYARLEFSKQAPAC
jgi:cytochrome b pre-mRNA-processing protein 3